MEPKSIESYTKQLKHIAKTFRPICPNFCFFWPLIFHMHQKATKNPRGGSLTWQRTCPNFLLESVFLIFRWWCPQMYASLAKSPDGKTSKPWLNQARSEDHGKNRMQEKFQHWRSWENAEKKRSLFLYLNAFIFFINAQKKRVFFIYIW